MRDRAKHVEMKRTTKIKIKKAVVNLTQEILWTLRNLAELMPYPFEGKYQHVQRLRHYDRYKVSRAFWELERKGLIKKVKKEQKIYYKITDLGRAKSFKHFYSQKPKIRKSNGLATIIIFDIPEEKKKARDFLRRFLGQNGFTMLQRSVFIGPWELHSEFKELLKELKLELHVSIIEGRVMYT